MATIKTLIEQLKEYEDQDQTIVFQFYTADMLTKTDADGNTENLTEDQMQALNDKVDDCDHFWDDVWEGISEFIEELDDEDDTDEDEFHDGDIQDDDSEDEE